MENSLDPQIIGLDESREYYFQEGCYILELLNSSADPDLSIARARVRAGETTRFHRLAGIVERYVIQEGKGMVEVGDLAPREVLPGDVVVIPPGCRQRVTSMGETDLVFLAVCTPRFTPDKYLEIGEEGEK